MMYVIKENVGKDIRFLVKKESDVVINVMESMEKKLVLHV